MCTFAHVYCCESRILATLFSFRVACHSFQMLREGVWSEIRVGGECPQLFTMSMAKPGLAPSEQVDNIQ